MVTSTTIQQSDYPTYQFTYTTVDIGENTFVGEVPDPLYFVMREPPVEVSPVVLTVIDGEICVIKDAPPPGAILPNYSSALFKNAKSSS